MGRPAKTLRFKNKDLWEHGGMTLYLGGAIVKFLVGDRGRRVKVEYFGKGKPRHKHKDLHSKRKCRIIPPG